LMRARTLSRRRFIAASAATALAAPFVRGAHAAGRLTVGIWDHWVPTANGTSKAIIEEWAARERVEVQIDNINNIGNKLTITIAAEAQARTGHDILIFPAWQPADHAKLLEPVDDIMAGVLKQNGPVHPAFEHLGKWHGR